MTAAQRHRFAAVALPLLILAHAATNSAAANTTGDAPRLEVVVSDDTVTLDAYQAPLRQVLAAIAAEAGFVLEIRGGIDEAVTQSMDRLAVPTAVRRLLDRYGYAYVADVAAGRAAGTSTLARLLVLSPRPSAPASGGAVQLATPVSDPRRGATDAAERAAFSILEQLLTQETDPGIRDTVSEALARFDARPG